jgi:hypothetical protein
MERGGVAVTKVEDSLTNGLTSCEWSQGSNILIVPSNFNKISNKEMGSLI